MATQTQTPTVASAPEAKPAPQPAPTVQVDTKLASLFKSSEQTWAEVITYIRDNLPKEEKVRDAIIRVTLTTPKEKGGRGLSPESAKTEMSRIRGYLKEENKGYTDQFIAGQITMAEHRALATGGSTKGRKSNKQKEADTKPEDKYKFALENAASLAVNIYPRTREQFVQDAGKVWDELTKRKEEIEASQKREAAKEQGSFTTEQPANKKQTKVPAAA